VLYKGRWMLPFRVLVRLKIFQLGGVAACAMPLGTFLTEVNPIPFIPPVWWGVNIHGRKVAVAE